MFSRIPARAFDGRFVECLSPRRVLYSNAQSGSPRKKHCRLRLLSLALLFFSFVLMQTQKPRAEVHAAAPPIGRLREQDSRGQGGRTKREKEFTANADLDEKQITGLVLCLVWFSVPVLCTNPRVQSPEGLRAPAWLPIALCYNARMRSP